MNRWQIGFHGVTDFSLLISIIISLSMKANNYVVKSNNRPN